MDINRSLIPTTEKFQKLSKQLASFRRLSELIHISDQLQEPAQDLLQYSIGTEYWRSYEKNLFASSAKKRSAFFSDKKKEILVGLAESKQSALDKQQLKLIRKANLVEEKLYEQGFLSPRSRLIGLASQNGIFQKQVSSSTGTTWLKFARRSNTPDNRKERLAFSFLISIGLLCAHPFQDGNGRLSRIIINTTPSTSECRPFPWSIFFLLRRGSYLYNDLLFVSNSMFDQSIKDYFGEMVNESIQVLERIKSFHWLRSDEASGSSAIEGMAGSGKDWHQLIHT